MRKLSTDELRRPSAEQYRAMEKLPIVVVLDNVRSQNNIGSIFRTSDAFRIEHISLCGICSTPPHREIHKTALGAEDSVAWSYHDNAAECIASLKASGYIVYAVEQVDDSLKLNKFNPGNTHSGTSRGIAVIFGNEVEGVSDELLSLCDGSIEIPQEGTKHSLNVSCAAAIVLWELWKNQTNANTRRPSSDDAHPTNAPDHD
ncbi:MAG: RNA methyltransferase [Bacteroidales bacterium]|nr:RNA methyltransferase [Bacteroidales bacterium]